MLTLTLFFISYDVAFNVFEEVKTLSDKIEPIKVENLMLKCIKTYVNKLKDHVLISFSIKTSAD